MSGERKGDREAIDRVTERIIGNGVRPEEAHEAARKSMERVDRKMREEGKR
jgi:hypothetical protein